MAQHGTGDQVASLIKAAQTVVELPDQLVDTGAAARFLGVTYQYLCNDRVSKRLGLSYVRIGRQIRYRTSVLQRYVEENSTEAA